jgi:hypothetical protein
MFTHLPFRSHPSRPDNWRRRCCLPLNGGAGGAGGDGSLQNLPWSMSRSWNHMKPATMTIQDIQDIQVLKDSTCPCGLPAPLWKNRHSISWVLQRLQNTKLQRTMASWHYCDIKMIMTLAINWLKSLFLSPQVHQFSPTNELCFQCSRRLTPRSKAATALP